MTAYLATLAGILLGIALIGWHQPATYGDHLAVFSLALLMSIAFMVAIVEVMR